MEHFQSSFTFVCIDIIHILSDRKSSLRVHSLKIKSNDGNQPSSKKKTIAVKLASFYFSYNYFQVLSQKATKKNCLQFLSMYLHTITNTTNLNLLDAGNYFFLSTTWSNLKVLILYGCMIYIMFNIISFVIYIKYFCMYINVMICILFQDYLPSN